MLGAIGNHLRHRLGGSTVALDYGDLRIVVHSETERFIRSHSAKKEPETVAFIESMPRHSVLWDVGANIGAYSLIAMSRGLHVVAFEPHPANMRSLLENQRLNGMRFPAHAYALSDHNGEVEFRWSSSEPGSALHRQIHGHDGEKRGERVACYRGDFIEDREPDFLKIDTDGGELDVLIGMGKLLDGVSGIMIEADAEITGWLKRRGFQETGRWAIPGFDCENVSFARECR